MKFTGRKGSTTRWLHLELRATLALAVHTRMSLLMHKCRCSYTNAMKDLSIQPSEAGEMDRGWSHTGQECESIAKQLFT